MGIEYKDLVTGEFKELRVKGRDTLPKGAIIEYDGDDIPEGYEEVEQELWGNSNPTAEFTAQTIELNSSEYDYYEIIYALVANGGSVCSTGKVPKHKLAYLNYVGGAGSLIGFARNITAVTGNTITFGDAVRINTNAVENDRCVPLRIIGY